MNLVYLNIFWADAAYTASYVLNRTLIRPILKKTPYELYKGRKHNISHLRVFGCKCFVLNNGKDNLGKFDPKSDEGIHIGYAINGHAYRVYNKRLLAVKNLYMLCLMKQIFLCPNLLWMNLVWMI